MNNMGTKIAQRRRDLGMTQIEFAENLAVTRQTVSRWEAGTVMPDIDKIADIAGVLGVSCDYLLLDDVTGDEPRVEKGVGRLLRGVKGKKVKLAFFDEKADVDLYDTVCTVVDFEGSWMKVSAEKRKGAVEKLIPVSSVLSFEILDEEA